MHTTTAGDTERIECNEAAGVGVFWLMALVLPGLGVATAYLAKVPLGIGGPARALHARSRSEARRHKSIVRGRAW